VSNDNDVASVLTADPRVDMVTFTGSTAVGRKILAAAAPTVKKTVMELGGKSTASPSCGRRWSASPTATRGT